MNRMSMRRIGLIVFVGIVTLSVAFVIARIVSRAGELTTGASVARSAAQISYLRRVENANFDVYLFQPDTAVTTQLTQGGQVITTMWSPDGEQLALLLKPDRPDNWTQIVSLKVATGQLVSLFEVKGDIANLQWTPDSKNLIFENSGNIMLYNSETSQLSTLVENGSNPMLSPDGQTIAFSSVRTENMDQEIYLTNLDGTVIRMLYQKVGSDKAIWSPDGQRLLIVNDTYANFEHELSVVNADGSGLVELGKHIFLYGAVSWSPDGQQIVYVSDTELCSIPLNANNSSCFTGLYSGISWSPDGKKITFGKTDLRSEQPVICVASSDALDNEQCFKDVAEGYSPKWRP